MSSGFHSHWKYSAPIALYARPIFHIKFTSLTSYFAVGMLACGLDVEVRFNIFLTIVSAAVAVLFTFAALSSPYASETIENSAPMRTLAKWNHEIYSGVANIFTGHPSHDLEAGYAPLQTTSAEDIPSVPPGVRVALDQDDIDISSDEDEEERQEPAPIEQRRGEDSGRLIYATASGDSSTLPTHRRSSFSQPENGRKSSKSPVARRSARHRLLHRVLSSSTTRRTSQESTPSSTSTTTTSSSESSFTRNLSGTTLATSSSSSWSEPLHPGLSRETRLRIKARAKERPPPEFGWRYWIKTHYESVTIFLCLRAAIWAGAIVFMHYCGTSIYFVQRVDCWLSLHRFRNVGNGNTFRANFVGYGHRRLVLCSRIQRLLYRVHIHDTHGVALRAADGV